MSEYKNIRCKGRCVLFLNVIKGIFKPVASYNLSYLSEKSRTRKRPSVVYLFIVILTLWSNMFMKRAIEYALTHLSFLLDGRSQ